jgi:hypothetical protein
MTVKVRVLGAKKSAANIRKMDRETRRAFFEELEKVAEQILYTAQEIYVPVLTGDLKRSGRMKSHKGRYPVIYVSFGGPDVPYALLQHEATWFNHPRGGRAKYLELAVRDFEPVIAEKLSVACRSEIKKHSMAGKVARG